MSVNKVILVGNLGKDPELNYSASNVAMCSLSIATSETRKDKQSGEKINIAEWHRVVMFGDLAEICEKFLKKGSQIYIEGKLRTRKWQDQQGIEKYSTEVLADTMRMLGSAASNNQNKVYESFAPASQKEKDSYDRKKQEVSFDYEAAPF